MFLFLCCRSEDIANGCLPLSIPDDIAVAEEEEEDSSSSLSSTSSLRDLPFSPSSHSLASPKKFLHSLDRLDPLSSKKRTSPNRKTPIKSVFSSSSFLHSSSSPSKVSSPSFVSPFSPASSASHRPAFHHISSSSSSPPPFCRFHSSSQSRKQIQRLAPSYPSVSFAVIFFSFGRRSSVFSPAASSPWPGVLLRSFFFLCG